MQAAARFEHVDVKGQISGQGIGRFERALARNEVDHVHTIQRCSADVAGEESAPCTRGRAARSRGDAHEHGGVALPCLGGREHGDAEPGRFGFHVRMAVKRRDADRREDLQPRFELTHDVAFGAAVLGEGPLHDEQGRAVRRFAHGVTSHAFGIKVATLGLRTCRPCPCRPCHPYRPCHRRRRPWAQACRRPGFPWSTRGRRWSRRSGGRCGSP